MFETGHEALSLSLYGHRRSQKCNATHGLATHGLEKQTQALCKLARAILRISSVHLKKMVCVLGLYSQPIDVKKKNCKLAHVLISGIILSCAFLRSESQSAHTDEKMTRWVAVKKKKRRAD